MPATIAQIDDELRRREVDREIARRQGSVFPEVPDAAIPAGYEDMGDKIRNSYYYSRTLGVDPNLTFDHEKEINELVYGKGTSSASAWQTTKKQYEKTNLWTNTKRAWTQASESWGAEHAGFLAMTGQISDEEALKISAQFKKRARENPIKARNWYEKQYLKLVGMAPAILGGKAEGAKFGLVGAGIGAGAAATVGAVPPLTLTPDEAITVPGGAAGGMVIGKMVGEMKFWSEQGAGAIYLQAREANVSKKTARIAAAIGGPIYGAIEFSQIDRFSPSLGKFKKNILTAALEIAKDIGVEVGEEGIQRATTDGAVLLSRIFEGQVKALDVPAETLTIAMNSWEEMKESVVPMAILMGPKAGATTLNILMEGSERGIENPKIANLEQKITEIVAPEEAEQATEVPTEPVTATPAVVEPSKAKEPTITPEEGGVERLIDNQENKGHIRNQLKQENIDQDLFTKTITKMAEQGKSPIQIATTLDGMFPGWRRIQGFAKDALWKYVAEHQSGVDTRSLTEILKKPTPEERGVVERYSTTGKLPKSGSVFFGPEGTGYADYGDVKTKHVISKDAKLYKGHSSSTDYVQSLGLFDKPLSIVKSKTGYDTLEQADEAAVQNKINPNQYFEALQKVAETELKKEGYDGAYWTEEDDLSPQQFQIWNRDVIENFTPTPQPTPKEGGVVEKKAKPEVKKAEEIETPEEAKEAERELDVEAAEIVEPELYIGNVTERMKRVVGGAVGKAAEDVKGFIKGAFPTKRTKVKLTKGEAEQYVDFLEKEIMRKLDANEVNTDSQIATIQAEWGDLTALRKVLGLPKGIAPFRVVRAGKHKTKIIKEAKARIKEAIRPTEESKMTVGEVLSAVLRRSARFAKMGFVKGRQELRAQMRAKARAKKRLNKALKTIQKKTPSTVDFFYREAIDALRGDIDLKGRSKRTEATIASRKEFLKRATEEERKDIPLKQIKQIGQKALNDMTIEELEAVATSIEQLVEQGKLKRQQMLKPEIEQRKKDIEELTENTEKVKPSRKKAGPQARSVTEKSLKDKIFDIVKPLTWRPSRLFDWLDGGKNFKGAWHRIFYDNVKGARANQIRTTNTRKEAFSNKLKELGVSLWDLAKMREVNGVRYSVQEVIGVYMASKNELSRMALNFGMEIEDADIKAIINDMTSEEIALGDFLLADYEANYSRLRRSVVEQENRDMGRQENYSPIRREGVNFTTLSSEFVDDIMNRDTVRRHTPAKGMTIQRKNVPASLQTKIRLDAINVWNEQVEKQERYIYMGPVVRHMNKVMANRNLRNVVAERFGNQVVEYISGQQGYISRVANPYIYRQFSDIEKISGRLRRNTATAYLAFNFVTMGKQLPSALLYMADAGPSHLLASAIDFATNPMAMIERTRNLDPELKNRSIERELEELKSAHTGNLLKQKVTEYGMEGIYLFDTVARTIGWNAVYQRALTEDKSEGEAIRLARNATLRTQPAAAAEDLPALYATSEFLNWFTMFTNQLNQIYNIATYDIPSYLRNEQYGDAAMQAFGMSIVALTIWTVTNQRLPEDPEDFIEAIGEQAINMIPLLGKPIMASRKGWSNDIPVLQAVGKTAKALSDLDITRNDTKAMAEAIAVMTGIPYTAVRRAIKAIEEEQPTALLGAR